MQHVGESCVAMVRSIQRGDASITNQKKRDHVIDLSRHHLLYSASLPNQEHQNREMSLNPSLAQIDIHSRNQLQLYIYTVIHGGRN